MCLFVVTDTPIYNKSPLSSSLVFKIVLKLSNSKILASNRRPSTKICCHNGSHRQHTNTTTMSTMMKMTAPPRPPLLRQMHQHQRQHQQQHRWHLLVLLVLLLPCICFSMPTYVMEIPSQKCIEVEGPVDSTIRIAYFIPGEYSIFFVDVCLLHHSLLVVPLPSNAHSLYFLVVA
jgi:hypothetical protein